MRTACDANELQHHPRQLLTDENAKVDCVSPLIQANLTSFI